MKTIYSFIGLPGSGKDTQAKILAEKKHFVITGIGDLVRKMMNTENTDPIITEAKERYKAGDPLTDEMAINLLKDFLKNTDSDVILTNFPLTINQAQFLDQTIVDNRWRGPVLFYINISPETAVLRATTRKICVACGEIHANYKGDKCIKCGGELISRADDNENVVRNRVNQWLPNVTSVSDYYRSKKSIIEIDGEKSVKEVESQVEKGLDEYSK